MIIQPQQICFNRLCTNIDIQHSKGPIFFTAGPVKQHCNTKPACHGCTFAVFSFKELYHFHSLEDRHKEQELFKGSIVEPSEIIQLANLAPDLVSQLPQGCYSCMRKNVRHIKEKGGLDRPDGVIFITSHSPVLLPCIHITHCKILHFIIYMFESLQIMILHDNEFRNTGCRFCMLN